MFEPLSRDTEWVPAAVGGHSRYSDSDTAYETAVVGANEKREGEITTRVSLAFSAFFRNFGA